MNRVLTGAAIGLAVVVGLMLNMQQVVSADQAIVVKDAGLCGMVGADENGAITFGGIGQITQQVENSNKVMMECKGTDVTNLSGSGQNFDGFLCGILTPEGGVLITEDSHATVSASGNGTMTCTFRK